MTDTEKAKKTRQIFIVSDGTAITAETLAHSILTQFPDLHYHQTRIPFVNSVEKAVDTARRINAVEREEGLRPIIFTPVLDLPKRRLLLRVQFLLWVHKNWRMQSR